MTAFFRLRTRFSVLVLSTCLLGAGGCAPKRNYDDGGSTGGGAGSSGVDGDGDGSGGNDGSGGGDGADSVAPTVVSVSPSGAGIRNDAPIVVTFSEAMDEASAAAISLTLDGTEVALDAGVWSEGRTRLTLQPSEPLLYATGVNPILDPHTYTVQVSTGAEDLAGNALTGAVQETFATLRRIETVINATDQRQYFLAEGSSVSAGGTSFYVRRQMGDLNYEDQWDYGLVVFNNTAPGLDVALGPDDTVTLELYAVSGTLDSASLEFKHIHGTNLASTSTPYATAPTTAVTWTTFPAVASWWSINLLSIFKHPSFNLSSYTSGLQILLTLETTGAGGTTRMATFNGLTHSTNKPRLRISRLVE
ncbi:MAG TPA: Ig-like domain-containing protein [Polyangiaceae bacterium]|nr:Ig-like domain-containing protein [Polyangiaceae bacterium]